MKLSELFEGLFTEAFGLSTQETRELFKNWDKTKWADIFNNKYRIYLPLENSSNNITDINSYTQFSSNVHNINIRIGGNVELVDGKKVKSGGTILTSINDLIPYFQEIIKELSSKGYKLVDYHDGYATKDGKNKKSIGSILSNNPTLKQFFDNDPIRKGTKAQSSQMVVISRHPVDIAGMSTDKGWTSCMNLHDGSNKKYVPIDIEEGTIIAYLTNINDKYIKNPSARVLIKPFYNEHNPKEKILGISNKIYGSSSKAFIDTVYKWVMSVNPKISGIFSLSKNLYNDLDDEQYYDSGKKISMLSYFNSKIKIPENIKPFLNSLMEPDNDDHILYMDDFSDILENYTVHDYQQLITFLIRHKNILPYKDGSKFKDVDTIIDKILYTIPSDLYDDFFIPSIIQTLIKFTKKIHMIPQEFHNLDLWKYYITVYNQGMRDISYSDLSINDKINLYVWIIKKFNLTTKNGYMYFNIDNHINISLPRDPNIISKVKEKL